MATNKIAEPEELRRLVTMIEQGLAGLPDPPLNSDAGRYTAWLHRHAKGVAALTVDLEETGSVRVSFGAGGVRVTAGGITATCTADTPGALRNWLTRARKRLEAEGGE